MSFANLKKKSRSGSLTEKLIRQVEKINDKGNSNPTIKQIAPAATEFLKNTILHAFPACGIASLFSCASNNANLSSSIQSSDLQRDHRVNFNQFFISF